MKQPSPAFNDADAVNTPVLPVFIPDAGDRQATAAVLTEAAAEKDLPQSHVRADAARGGFWISDALADIVYDGAEANAEDEPEPSPKTPDKAPAKTGSTKKKGTRS